MTGNCIEINHSDPIAEYETQLCAWGQQLSAPRLNPEAVLTHTKGYQKEARDTAEDNQLSFLFEYPIPHR